MWENGLKQGHGIYEFSNPKFRGISLEGEWDQNKLVRGQWKLCESPSSILYEGCFANNQPRKGEGNAMPGRFVFGDMNIVQTGEFDEQGRWNPDFSLQVLSPSVSNE